MKSFSRILVDIEASAPEHPALAQAVDLAARCGAGLTIVDVLPEVPAKARRFLPPHAEEELAAYRRGCLTEIAKRITKVPVATALLRGRPATAIVHEVVRVGHDLLVRAHGRDLAAAPGPFGPIDMELLRHCPCPVWLIGPGKARRPRRILAAVHAQAEDAVEQALNASIIELALTLRDLEDGELTILEAWSLYGEDLLRPRMSPGELATHLDGMRQAVEADLSALVAPFGDRLRAVDVECRKGRPDDVIPEFVESHAVDLVVMGTVARTGIAGLVMGNTAERVLQRLHGDVLAIKPKH